MVRYCSIYIHFNTTQVTDSYHVVCKKQHEDNAMLIPYCLNYFWRVSYSVAEEKKILLVHLFW